ncbi:hypothetical protein JTB14_031226 [Gonioctena quinquepunctata]|nr:hypothetical protein JTB14_031226 [Gonioctena quinquepunctata]
MRAKKPETDFMKAPLTTPNITLSLDLSDPQDVIVQKGQGAVLRCRAKSTKGDVQILWLHNNETIISNGTKWKKQDYGELYISKVTTGKKSNGAVGDYRCLARNEVGAVLSNVAKLRVASIERQFSINPGNVTVSESQPAILRCGIRSTPAADIQWEFNGELILPHQTRYVPLPSGALLIKKTSMLDSGSYRCRATNSLLNKVKNSTIAEVTVLSESNKTSPPLFLPANLPTNISVNLNEQINLYCVVMGWPAPTIQWFDDDDVLIGNSTILRIPQAQLRHSGSYSCLAFSSLGRISQKFYVNVHQKPFFNVVPVSKSYPSSITARLECQADGVPEPKITWLKNGRPMKFEYRIKMHNNGLIISPTITHDSGIYQCVATNLAGSIWAAARVEINVSQIVNPPHSLKCRPYDSQTICLNWKISHNALVQGYSIHSLYKVEGKEVAGPEFVAPNDMTYQNASGLNGSTNYTFYVRLYSYAASDPSENVSCRTGTIGKRNLDIEPFGVDSVELTWSEVSTDISCDGERYPYKVEWRREVPKSSNSQETNEKSFVINGLSPGVEYGFRILTEAENNPQWIQYILPDISKIAVQNGSENSNSNQMELAPPPPGQIKTLAVSPLSVKLNWTNSGRNSNYFTVCYVPVLDSINCENGTLLKSLSNVLQVKKLKPNTTYEFRVRTHDLKGTPGPFSDPVIVQTLVDVPSPVLDLSYKIINESTACLQWKAPIYKGGKLRKYLISYTPDINWAFENWMNISLPAKDENSVSALLGNLSTDSYYRVLVRAVSEVGPGRHAFPLVVSTKIIKEKPDQAEELYHQKIGIIIGSILALLCVICCISCILIRRRCVKRRALARARMAPSNNYCPAVAHYASRVGSVQVILQNPHNTDAQESQFLVPEGHTINIPPVSPTYFDTKGREEFPNGHANGSTKPFMNGHVHITENPQYLSIDCNGRIPKNPEYSPLKRFEEDSNSNINLTKFQDLQRLFDNSKKSKSSNYHQCDPHFGQKDHDPCSSCDEVNSCGSSADTSLNTTQMTSLNDSEIGVMNNNRRKLPISGPNG